MPLSANDNVAGLIPWAALSQICGTDNGPSATAWPILADAGAGIAVAFTPTWPSDPGTPTPELSPRNAADPILLTPPVVALIVASAAVTGATADDVGDASSCSASGSAEINWDRVIRTLGPAP